MTLALTPSDVAELAAELTDYLYDRGDWGPGSGGEETVAQIAEFISSWKSGERLRREQERKERRDAKVFLDGDRLRVIQRRAPPWTPKV